MNIRRMMASGSHLWKRAFTTVAALPSAGIETSITAPAAAAARVKPDMAKLEWIKDKKRMMLVKLLDIDERAVKETIDKFKSDYEEQKQQSRSFGKRTFHHVSVTKADLYSWAKRLEKQGKRQHAIEIFEWMEEKKMSFTTDQLAFYVGLTGKVKDWETARDCNKKVDPNFNQMDHSSPALDPNFNSLSESHAFSTQQPTHCLGLNAIADVASLISPSVVKLHIPAGCYGDATTDSDGTGFLIDHMGTILTCSDVVINPYRPDESSRDEVVVITKDGKKLRGEVEFYRKELEISIVKIKTDKKLSLPHLNLETPANPFVGQWVLCLGSHGTHNHSLTKGIISHLHRTSSDIGIKGAFNVYIQTDCPISEGSFGSPLLDLSGNVIGIVAKIERKGEGIGFALEIKTVCDILRRYYTLGKDGYVPNCGMIDNL